MIYPQRHGRSRSACLSYNQVRAEATLGATHWCQCLTVEVDGEPLAKETGM